MAVTPLGIILEMQYLAKLPVITVLIAALHHVFCQFKVSANFHTDYGGTGLPSLRQSIHLQELSLIQGFVGRHF